MLCCVVLCHCSEHNNTCGNVTRAHEDNGKLSLIQNKLLYHTLCHCVSQLPVLQRSFSTIMSPFVFKETKLAYICTAVTIP